MNESFENDKIFNIVPFKPNNSTEKIQILEKNMLQSHSRTTDLRSQTNESFVNDTNADISPILNKERDLEKIKESKNDSQNSFLNDSFPFTNEVSF